MAAISLYITGTISFTLGSSQIIGSGTSFTSLIAGDPIQAPDGQWYEVTPDDNSIAVLDRPYEGPSVADSAGGVDWFIFKSSVARDSVRTASKQLSEITTLYRDILNLTSSDQIVRLDKDRDIDRAGLILQKAGIDKFAAGTFEDDDFAIRYLAASTWTKALGVSADGATSIYSQLLLGGVITPVAITQTIINYNPPGLDKANIVRVSSDSDWAITGLAGGVDGRVLVVMNSGEQPIWLENDGGISIAANRFALTDDLEVQPDQSVLLIYDGTAARWKQLGIGSGGSGSSGEGEKGWAPVLAYVADGAERVVAQIVDWTGGEGTKPSSGSYIGPLGLVETKSLATSVRGQKGDSVQFRLDLVRRYIQWSYVDTIEWVDLITFDAITGPTSAPEWQFDTLVTDTDPGNGLVRFNHGTFGSITRILISKQTRYSADVSAFINSWDDSSSLPNRGVLAFSDVTDPSKFANFLITGAVIDAGAYIKIPVTPTAGSVPTTSRRMSALFLRTGDKGISGLIPRGTFNIATDYLIGDVVDQDGSSYISLVQPNLGHAPAFEANNSFWALFARGVNAEFVAAINASLAASQAAAAAALASQLLATAYAVKVNGYAANTDNSAMSWAIGGTGAGQPGAGDARSWATKLAVTVDGTNYSAKQYALNAQTSMETSYTLEASAAANAALAQGYMTSALSSANTSAIQAALATAQAVIATTGATTATGKAAEAVVSAAAALVSKNDAAASATLASASAATATTKASEAAGSATAAAGYAAILASPDYGFWTEAPTDTRDYGSFV